MGVEPDPKGRGLRNPSKESRTGQPTTMDYRSWDSFDIGLRPQRVLGALEGGIAPEGKGTL